MCVLLWHERWLTDPRDILLTVKILVAVFRFTSGVIRPKNKHLPGFLSYLKMACEGEWTGCKLHRQLLAGSSVSILLAAFWPLDQHTREIYSSNQIVELIIVVNVCCHDYGTSWVTPPRGSDCKEEGHVGPRSGPSVTTYGPSVLEVAGLVTLLFLVSLSTDTFMQVVLCRCMLYIICWWFSVLYGFKESHWIARFVLVLILGESINDVLQLLQDDCVIILLTIYNVLNCYRYQR